MDTRLVWIHRTIPRVDVRAGIAGSSIRNVQPHTALSPLYQLSTTVLLRHSLLSLVQVWLSECHQTVQPPTNRKRHSLSSSTILSSWRRHHVEIQYRLPGLSTSGNGLSNGNLFNNQGDIIGMGHTISTLALTDSSS